VIVLLQALVHDIHVICGCLKDFLRGLKEPLITFRLWNAFASAAGESHIISSYTADCVSVVGVSDVTKLVNIRIR